MTISRREFLAGTGAALGVAVTAHGADTRAPGGAPATTLALNGAPRELVILDDTTLAEAVRAEGLTGTKLSCESGACGACTVHIDGAPRASCLTLASEVAGARITTIEGISQGQTLATLHPVQRAIVEADALQCGFCTPGFVMSGVAFFDGYRAAKRTDEPSVDEVQRALAGNLCRCGAQLALVEAVRAACVGRRARPPGGAVIGEEHALSRTDAIEKVTGRAQYTVDVQLTGMLHAAFLRSPVPAARIKKLDVTPALRVPGVRAVDTSPIERKDGLGRLRYTGQPIAVVAADTLAAAREGAARITLDLETRPFVIDPIDAQSETAALVYEDDTQHEAPGAGEAPKEPEALRKWSRNVRSALAHHTDDEDPPLAGTLERSAVRVDLSVRTHVQVHTTLERHATVAAWKDGKLTLWASTQTVQAVAQDLAKRLGVPQDHVRVLSPYVGGGFGAKASLKPEHVAAALLARTTGRPVRLELSADEHTLVGGHRPGTQHRVRVGATARGALEGVVHVGRSFCGTAVGERSTGLSNVHYDWAPIVIVDKNVVTNTPPACAFRAPGYPANAFALEQAIDEVAARTHVHPLTLRAERDTSPARKRVLQLLMEKTGRGARLLDVGSNRTGRFVRERFVRGVGVATAEWFVLTAPSTRVELTAGPDGRVTVRTATHDLGQGARTVLQSVVVDRLGVAPDALRVDVGDSALPTASGTFGSLTTTSISTACLRACEALEDLITKAVARTRRVERAAGGLHVDGTFRSFASLLPELERPTTVSAVRGDDREGFKIPPGKLGALAEVTPAAFSKDIVASAQLAEVEVDRALGTVRALRVVIALDAGRLIAPITARSQVVGGVLQGVSRALYEERRLDRASGHALSRTLESYPILGVADAPEVTVHFVDQPSPNTPTGALGLGENSTIATCAAIANAFFRATGRRALTSPITPRRVLEVLA